MKILLAFAFCLLSLTAVAAYQPTWLTTNTTPPNPTGIWACKNAYSTNAIVCCGDSFTSGVGGTYNNGYNNYPQVLGNMANVPTFNVGQGGDTSVNIYTNLLNFYLANPQLTNNTLYWESGYNDLSGTTTNNTITNIVRAIQLLSPTANYWVLGCCNSTNQYIGTSGYGLITNLNAALAAHFPGHYIPIREWRNSHGNTNIAGDFTAFVNDTCPPSQTSALDGLWLHPNDYGYLQYGAGVYYYSYIVGSQLENSFMNKAANEESFIQSWSAINISALYVGGFNAIQEYDAIVGGQPFVQSSYWGHSGNSVNQGVENVAFGPSAFALATNGTQNTAVGFAAMSSVTNGIPTDNTALGFDAFQYGYGSEVTGVGAFAARNAEGFTVAVGYSAAQNYTGNSGVDAFGNSALNADTTGGANSAFGDDSLYQLVPSEGDGAYNAAFGYFSGSGETGYYKETFLGDYADAGGNDYYYAIAIGFGAIASGVGDIALGTANNTTIHTYSELILQSPSKGIQTTNGFGLSITLPIQTNSTGPHGVYLDITNGVIVGTTTY